MESARVFGADPFVPQVIEEVEEVQVDAGVYSVPEAGDLGLPLDVPEVYVDIAEEVSNACCFSFPGPVAEASPSTASPEEEEEMEGDEVFVEESVIGRGMTGDVVLARNRRGEVKAIKKFSRTGCRKTIDSNEKMFKQEEATYRKLQGHCYILEGVCTYVDESFFYLLLPYCPEGDLHGKLKSLEHDKILPYFGEILVVMLHLFAKCVAHLDVKPANLLIGPDGHLRLTDFGLSMLLPGSEVAISNHGGTEVFQPPEVFSGGLRDPFKIDSYAVGVTLWSMLHKKTPSTNLDFEEERPKWKHLPHVFRYSLKSLLQPDPDERPNIQTFVENLTAKFGNCLE